MSRKWLLLAVLVSAFFGGTVVGLIADHANRQFSVMFSSALFDRDTYMLNSNIKELRALHQGDMAAAIESLESDVTRNLEVLSSYHDIVPREARRSEVYRVLGEARSYRFEVPRVYEVPGVRDAVGKALSLQPEAGK